MKYAERLLHTSSETLIFLKFTKMAALWTLNWKFEQEYSNLKKSNLRVSGKRSMDSFSLFLMQEMKFMTLRSWIEMLRPVAFCVLLIPQRHTYLLSGTFLCC